MNSFLNKLTVRGTAAIFVLGTTSAMGVYPDKPIRMVVPYAPGGSTDVTARFISSKMTGLIGQTVVVENKPGAATALGAEYVAKSAPDGYTLLMAAGTTLSTNPHLYKKLRYKVEDFAPISGVSKGGFALEVAKNFPINTVADLVAMAKAKPGEVNYAMTGVGSTPHIAGETIAAVLGIKLNAIAFKGAGPAMNDLIGGHVHMHVDGVSTAIAPFKAGQIKVIATMSDERIQTLPGVPTFKELGYPDLVANTWFGLLAPAGTPTDIINKLSESVRKSVAMPDVVERLRASGDDPIAGTPAEFAAFLKRESDRWGAMIRRLGVLMEEPQ
jgi:tripartite-type tricarboxylate transporter receptor subunit TctC